MTDKMFGPLALHTSLTLLAGYLIGYSGSLDLLISITMLIVFLPMILFVGHVTVHQMYLGLGASMEND